MKVGYTEAETVTLFDSLRDEVFDYFGYTHPVNFVTRPSEHHAFGGHAIAATSFGSNPDDPWDFSVMPYASAVLLNEAVLPWVYEDEMISILLHELTHVTAGLAAQHGEEWQRHAREVGTLPVTFMVIRNWELAWEPFSRGWFQGERSTAPTLDLYADMSL